MLKLIQFVRKTSNFSSWVLRVGPVLCMGCVLLQGAGSKVESVTGSGASGSRSHARSLDRRIRQSLRRSLSHKQRHMEQTKQTKPVNKQTKQAAQAPQKQQKASPEDMVENRKDGIVGGIALTVNNDPITLYQIEMQEKVNHVNRQQAINSLILQCIQAQEIKRLKIDIEDDKVDAEIENIAKHNGMNVSDFMRTLAGEGINPVAYKAQLKKQLETRELLRNILLFNANTNSETKMREYYNAHRDEFTVPSDVLATRYTAKDTQTLTQALEHKDTDVPGVTKGEERISIKALNPQIAQMFLSTKEHTFTPILNAGGGNYVAFYIEEKLGKQEVSFAQARGFIANKLIEEQQDKILAEYYEKLRVKAKIKFLR
ncbi:hypothetical protein NHP194003_07460 [Helicobacter suis]|uniref:peptidylprolyl isomerase n=1 Tax=Helicobacter suis TaxID=104628 RepID=UPI0015970604|nr:peptidylprolyl isomerase [Helicobacter suis]BCD47542.1 hypothetical protein NHP194003_07460 [Helicobacter suis]